MSLEYFLGNLGAGDHSSEQAKRLRDIILTNKPEPEILSDLKRFVLSQNELYPDAASIINKAIMTHYGSEYLGLGKGDFLLKSILYKQFIEKFPDEFGFKFYYADCCLMTNKSENEIFPILKEGMLQDKANINYPSTDLFDLIQQDHLDKIKWKKN
jgi:hypothetical protein